MADAKISQLTALTTAADDDLLAIVDTSATETKKIAKSDLVAGLQAELVSGTNIKTINSTSLLGSGDIAIAANPAGTAGQIQFSDGSAFAADSNLFWDNTNKRLGVGTSSPSYGLDVSQNINGGIFARLQNTNSNGFGMLLNAGDGSTQYTMQWGNYFGGSGGRIYPEGIIVGQQSVPSARLHIKGSGSTAASTSLLVQNSSGTELLMLRDDGLTTMNRLVLNSALRVQFINTLNDAYTSIYLNGSNGNANFPETITIGAGLLSPNASAKLQIDSTTSGFLPPRMTTTQKNAISSPASGLIVYDTTTNKLCCYNGTSWNDLF